jgi:hypothetical protein
VSVSAGEDDFSPPVTCVMLAGTCEPLSKDGKRRRMVANSRKPQGISMGSNPSFPSWRDERKSNGKYETPCRP